MFRSHLLLRNPGVLQENKPNFRKGCFQLFAQPVQLLLRDLLLSQAVRAKVHDWDAHFKNAHKSLCMQMCRLYNLNADLKPRQDQSLLFAATSYHVTFSSQ